MPPLGRLLLQHRLFPTARHNSRRNNSITRSSKSRTRASVCSASSLECTTSSTEQLLLRFPNAVAPETPPRRTTMTDHEDDGASQPPPSPDDEDQLWADLEACVATQCTEHESIDDALRSWLDLTTRLRCLAHVDSQDEVVAAAQLLEASSLFRTHRSYIRTQIIHSLLQEDETASLHAIACLL